MVRKQRKLVCAGLARVGSILLTGLAVHAVSAGASQSPPSANPNQNAATVAPAQRERPTKAQQIQRMIESMPLVPSPMTTAELVALFTRVGLLPVADANQVAFDEALTAAIARSDASRASLKAVEMKQLIAEMAVTMESTGYPSIKNAPAIKAVRAKASEIDSTLIEDAARGISIPSAEKIVWAQMMHRADIAAQTMFGGAMGAMKPFGTVTPAFVPVLLLSGSSLENARSLLLSDCAERADLAEHASWEVLVAALLSGETAIDLQTAHAKIPEDDRKLEIMALTGIAMLIQMRGTCEVAVGVATLDAALVERVESQLPVGIAFDTVVILEQSMGGSRRPKPEEDIADLERRALNLPGIAQAQKQAIQEAASLWKHAQMKSFAMQLKTDAIEMAEAVTMGRGLVANDPSTWDMSSGPSQMERGQQAIVKRAAREEAGRIESERATKAIESIVGPESWAVIAPKPKATPSKRNESKR